jgi:hypothetical protein
MIHKSKKKRKTSKSIKQRNTSKSNNKTKNAHNHTKKKIKMVKLNCSPKDKNEINKFSCYTNESLLKLRNLWNARHPDFKIKTRNPKQIHSFISQHLSDLCNKESCWLKQTSEFGDIDNSINQSFAPESPKEWKKNPNEWLSSIDIMKVMKQYEKTYKCFEFIGPTPIDFDKKIMYGQCVWNELCKFNLEEQIKNGKTKIGVIFNTDTHDKPGEHWISLFINIKKGFIYFFDSVGRKAPPEIMKLVDKIKEQGLSLKNKIEFIFDQNYPVEHQYGDTECGIYSIYFIIHMLEDKITQHYLKTHILKDKYMEKFRKIYFNESL